MEFPFHVPLQYRVCTCVVCNGVFVCLILVLFVFILNRYIYHLITGQRKIYSMDFFLGFPLPVILQPARTRQGTLVQTAKDSLML